MWYLSVEKILLIASADDTMKIELAMISFMENTASSKVADQNDDFISKESCRSLSVF